LTKGKSGWVKCPICGVKMRAEKLKGHKKRVHPKGAKTTEERRKIERRRRTVSGTVKWTVVAVIIIVIILVSYYVYTHYDFTRGDKVGDKPYNFVLADQDGFIFELDDYLGEEPVLMGFFSYECDHCKRMAETFQALYVNYSDDIVIVGLMGGKDGLSHNDVKNWALERGAEYPILYDKDRDQAYNKYEFTYVPRMYLVDSDGKITWVDEGVHTYDDMEEKIKEVI